MHRVANRSWKPNNSSNFLPFTLISALILFVLFVVILLFSVLTSAPYALALFINLLDEVRMFTTAAARKIDIVREL